MADVKREVRALGQKITGLKAGDSVTLVLKKPKPAVDATSAKRAAKVSKDNVTNAKEALAALQSARDAAASGDGKSAQKLVAQSQRVLDTIRTAIGRAKEWSKNAASDADSAPGEVKDGYGAAKDGAELAVGHLEKVADGLEQAVRATGAFVEEVIGRG